MDNKRAILFKAFLFTTLLWGGITLFSFAISSDFGAERHCGFGLSGRCKLTMCGFIRGVLPGAADAAPCWLLDVMPMMLIPGFVLWRIIQNEARLLLGERRRTRQGSRCAVAEPAARRERRAGALARNPGRSYLLQAGHSPCRSTVVRLHHNVASPFVRKVMAVAIETGLDGRFEPVTRMMTPVKPDPDLAADNPLGKIPCLVTDDGMALYDSRVICEYLDSLHAGPRMFPTVRRAGPRCAGRQRATVSSMPRCSAATRPSCARRSGAGRNGSRLRSRRSAAPWMRSRPRPKPSRPSTSAPSPSAARSAISTFAMATRTGGSRGRSSPPGLSSS